MSVPRAKVNTFESLGSKKVSYSHLTTGSEKSLESEDITESEMGSDAGSSDTFEGVQSLSGLKDLCQKLVKEKQELSEKVQKLQANNDVKEDTVCGNKDFKELRKENQNSQMEPAKETEKNQDLRRAFEELRKDNEKFGMELTKENWKLARQLDDQRIHTTMLRRYLDRHVQECSSKAEDHDYFRQQIGLILGYTASLRRDVKYLKKENRDLHDFVDTLCADTRETYKATQEIEENQSRRTNESRQTILELSRDILNLRQQFEELFKVKESQIATEEPSMEVGSDNQDLSNEIQELRRTLEEYQLTTQKQIQKLKTKSKVKDKTKDKSKVKDKTKPKDKTNAKDKTKPLKKPSEAKPTEKDPTSPSKPTHPVEYLPYLVQSKSGPYIQVPLISYDTPPDWKVTKYTVQELEKILQETFLLFKDVKLISEDGEMITFHRSSRVEFILDGYCTFKYSSEGEDRLPYFPQLATLDAEGMMDWLQALHKFKYTYFLSDRFMLPKMRYMLYETIGVPTNKLEADLVDLMISKRIWLSADGWNMRWNGLVSIPRNEIRRERLEADKKLKSVLDETSNSDVENDSTKEPSIGAKNLSVRLSYYVRHAERYNLNVEHAGKDAKEQSLNISQKLIKRASATEKPESSPGIISYLKQLQHVEH